MPNKMLIDASHPEETRVVVLRGNRVEEFDFESASKKQLRGNIYLAKVTRVEPSLQAAFIDYGGNRHGFLAFSEIHPDYYQIPVADRQALLEDESREHEEEEEEERKPRRSRRNRRREHAPAEKRVAPTDETVTEAASEFMQGEAASGEPSEAAPASGIEQHLDGAPAAQVSGEPAAPESSIAAQVPHSEEPDEVAAGSSVVAENEDVHEAEADSHGSAADHEAGHEHPSHEPSARAPEEHDEDEDDDDEEEEEEHVEQIGGDALEELPRRPTRMRRQYKIQEVIKRRQVLLVQVVKEERGNKGAALTTYLSLAGRYSVLMPNTARGGGISRKITDTGDRKRLKTIAQDLEVPEGMGVILRTAGAMRTRAEVKRDFEYLLRMWENVRETTLRSSAPMLVYEEGSLIKRAIRDLYNKEIDEVSVSGAQGFREAKEFMRMIMPGHAKHVVPWQDAQPIFVRSGVEAQLDAMFSTHVTLKSGGYLVINQAEALVAIDVNSGRSTREHNIEDTAVRTNLEAADEVARQLRLRDLAGLIVVDFIDMEEPRNNRSVERRLKEALKNDRARIQVGRISHFGLLEMSRQRIRTGVLEGSTMPCPHCAGSGMMRSVSSVALHVLRIVEDALTKSATHDLIVKTRPEAALYILNHKRSHLRDIERRFGVHISVEVDDTLTGTVYHAIERGELATGTPEPYAPPSDWDLGPDPEDDIAEVEAEDETGPEAEEEQEAPAPRRPRHAAPAEAAVSNGDEEEESESEGSETAEAGETNGDGSPKRRRRRRRRGRGGDRESGGFQSGNAPQPPDDGLAFMASVDGTGYVHRPAEGAIAEAGPSEGSSRESGASAEGASNERNGFWAREQSNTPVPFEPVSEPGIANEATAGSAPVETHVSASTSASPETSVDVPAAPAAASEAAPPATATAKADASQPDAPQPEAAASAPLERSEPLAPKEAAPVAPPREPTEVVITEAKPDQPKRGGWWQRAKASLGGN